MEDAATTMFDGTGLLSFVPDEPAATNLLNAAIHDDRLWVAVAGNPVGEAGDVVVGFALGVWCGDDAHLQELDVLPEWGCRGIGRRLVSEVIAWAGRNHRERVTLTTFADVAWNAPFYARLGFSIVPATAWTDALRAVWEHEREMGLPMDQRVVMASPVPRPVP
ncbi:MAG: GNAT family N-acetyltransferase [Acidimicrobiia bacterium]